MRVDLVGGHPTVSTASSFKHKYWMIQHFCFLLAKSIGSYQASRSSTCCKAKIFLFASLCPFMLKKSSPKLWLHQYFDTSEGANSLTRMVNHRHYME